MIATSFRTDDLSRWGAGSGQGSNGNLTATQADLNFWELKTAVEDILTNPPSPVQIAAFEVAGIGMIIRLTDGTAVGPLPLPVLAWRWLGAWLPHVPYSQLDVFMVEGTGLFLVLLDHTSAASFDPAATSGGNALYRELIGLPMAPGGATGQMLRKASDADFDVSWEDAPLPVAIFMPGVPANAAIARIVMTEAATFPANFTGSYGPARVASTGSNVAVTIKRNSDVIGTATYPISNTPTFLTTGGTAQVVSAGDIIEFLFPSSPDSTLADIAITLRAIRT